ncbi:MAG: hypothetical protein B7Z51_08260, partial [Methyloversatilis sp. 12-65-5]
LAALYAGAAIFVTVAAYEAAGGPLRRDLFSDDGKAYLNLHSSEFPGGEIRGFLAPVPEPETYALMLAGLGLIGWAARRGPRAAA